MRLFNNQWTRGEKIKRNRGIYPLVISVFFMLFTLMQRFTLLAADQNPCIDAKPGIRGIGVCLNAHLKELSEPCKNAVQAAKEAHEEKRNK